MGDGKALQMGTSHNLGQNFAKPFNVTFLDRAGNREFPWSTSWAVTTRLIGAIVMVHGDAKGLRLPPRIAPTQAVIVPIWRRDEERVKVAAQVEEVQGDLSQAAVRVHVDWRDQVTPGFKFNDWELRGVPVRIEIGPRDVDRGQVVIARRDTAGRETVEVPGASDRVQALLEEIQRSLLRDAREYLEEHTASAAAWDELVRILGEQRGFVWVNWCDSAECEAKLAGEKATVRAIPLHDAEATPTGPCICCGQAAQFRCVVARSY